MTADDLAAYEWRVGGHGNCSIFAMRGYDRDADMSIGLMTTPRLAAAVVDEHNAAIGGREDTLARSLYPTRAARDGVDEYAPRQDIETPEPTFGAQKGPAPG